ncbi:uncharacterized protein CDV56_103135 [Aspergillus thermomutatus]|uniref:Uncharacterized protein n=1 Tax=Aspergillus thermomutatus TaxID=41047 RepID=A0A397G8U6_ASPTH|nr:uncharacterized protein CDV56_103135 [Aspergillus thermomutatus]RHZ45333.1 hypothetical protein CDV56_103135 [Aspergillus thermomutatus]
MSPEDYRRAMLVYTMDQMAAFIMSDKATRGTTSAACSANNTNNSSFVSAPTARGSGRLVTTLASLPEPRKNDHGRRPASEGAMRHALNAQMLAPQGWSWHLTIGRYSNHVKRSRWKTGHELQVDPLEPSEVKRVARKDARNRDATYMTKIGMLTPVQCFEAAIEDATNTILMELDGELVLDEETMASTAREMEL